MRTAQRWSMRSRVGAALGILSGVLFLLATLARASAGTTERVSVDSAGTQGDSQSQRPAISADGRFVAFHSWASNLVPGDTNGFGDVFVQDRQTGTTERVSVASDGTQGNNSSYSPAISADGRFVAFTSYATNLVPADTNGRSWSDVFVHDRQTGTTERVSVASDGTPGNSWSEYPAISADGRFVAFQSSATNLVPGDTNGSGWDVLIHDRQTGTTERVGPGQDPALSADGRFVAFARWRQAVPMGSRWDVFVHDRQTGTDELVSVDIDGNEGNGTSGDAAISADGRFVAFESSATNLVPGDTNGAPDVFVRDRQTGTTERVSVATDGTQGSSPNWRSVSSDPAISADGRFVAFASHATNLVPGDTNWDYDVFVHDRQTGTTERVSVASDGTPGNGWSFNPGISADGRFVAFASSAFNLVPGDTNRADDVFVRDRGAQAADTTTVSFDSPAPPGGPGPLDGVFQGIDFGTGQWVWEGPYDVDSTNNIYFADSTGTARTVAFSPAPRVLQSLRVFSPESGTLTLSDDAGQTLSQDVTTGSMQLVTTGWTRPSSTVTVSFTMGWSLGVDDITHNPAP